MSVETLSIISSLFGIIFSPMGAYLAWRSYKKAGAAAAGTDTLSKRMTGRSIFRSDGSIDEQ